MGNFLGSSTQDVIRQASGQPLEDDLVTVMINGQPTKMTKDEYAQYKLASENVANSPKANERISSQILAQPPQQEMDVSVAADQQYIQSMNRQPDVYSQLMAQSKKSKDIIGTDISAQKEMVDKLRGSLEREASKTDITPLVQWVNQMTGSKFTSKSPIKDSEIKEKLFGAMEKLGKRNQDLAEKDIEMAKYALARQQKGSMDEDKKRQLAMASKPFQAIEKKAGLVRAIDTLDSAISQYGVSPTGIGSAEISQAYNDLFLQYKEANNLGAALSAMEATFAKGTLPANISTLSPDELTKFVMQGGQNSAIKLLRNLKDKEMIDINTKSKTLESVYGKNAISPLIDTVRPVKVQSKSDHPASLFKK